jgi:hypothetical protein
MVRCITKARINIQLVITGLLRSTRERTVIKLPVLDKVFDLTDALLFIVDSVPVENLRATLFSEILFAPTETEQAQI